MEIRTRKLRSSGTWHLSEAAILSLAAGAALAATLFIANNQPWGYVAPPALSSSNFSRGNVVAYTPWFENGTFRGDLIASPVTSSGAVNLLVPMWRAAPVLDGQHYQTGRRIVTSDGIGSGIPFQFLDLTPAQQLQVGSASILDYVRGDRSNESAAGMRVRSSVLGDIIHSAPVYVGRPVAGYNFGGYLAFASANAGRAARVYVGANDGMVHAFDATNGSEVFAYVPSMVMADLPKLAAQPYSHQYFVDGFLNVQDAQFGGSWHSVLAGGLGAGGKGYFALDVTSAGAATEAAAAGKVLWEFHTGNAGAANLGFSYSRPSIVRLANGQWAVVVANGYLNASGVASLYVLDVQTGAVIRELAVPDFNANGLSSPTVIDADADGHVDVAYAGDLNGNLWKFDLGSASPATWSIAYGGQPLFQTVLANGVRQAITTAPEVGRHPEGGVMVYFGTGRLFSDADSADKTTQAVYGIWDNDWAAGIPISIAQLRTQQLKGATHVSGAAVRVATANYPDWLGGHRGWMTPTEIAAATALDQGERVLQDISLRANRISFMSINPTVGSGDNWFIQLDALTGGAPSKTIVDVNSDSVLNVGDNVDGNADGAITDVAADRVVGQYQSFGLASRPVIGVLSAGSNVALINHLTAILPTEGPTPDGNDPGLLGGHLDLDTSHLIYPFDTGAPACDAFGLPAGCVMAAAIATTDGHVHQWDDVHNLTTIDYFGLPDGSGNPLHEINDNQNAVAPSKVFLLTVANQNLSPGGVLEINGASISVGNYRLALDRYLSGTLGPGESFPLFKLNAPTAAETLAGVLQLTSLKLSFDTFAILAGDLIPTVTGCVKGNTAGAQGEYRNGALMLQALDASSVAGGFVFNAATQRYVAGSTAVKSPLGYATDGLLWESTVFWHWSGPCYGDPGWAPLFDSCVVQGLGGCAKDEVPEEPDPGDPPAPGDPPPPPPPPPPVEADPGHGVTNTTIRGNNDTGRLFWRELLPQE